MTAEMSRLDFIAGMVGLGETVVVTVLLYVGLFLLIRDDRSRGDR